MTWLYRILAGSLLLILVTSAIAIRFARLSHALRRAEQERLIAQNQSKTSETRFQELFFHMTSGFAQFEVVRSSNDEIIDFRFIEVNPAFGRMTGLSGENLVGKCISSAFPELGVYWMQNIRAISGEPKQFECYIKSRECWLAIYAYSVAKGLLAVLMQDITQRRLAELALMKSEEQFR